MRWFYSFRFKLGRAPRWNRFLGPALILLVAAMASAPIVLHGPYCGDDYQFHLVSWLDAQQSWRQGILYPHWTPSDASRFVIQRPSHSRASPSETF